MVITMAPDDTSDDPATIDEIASWWWAVSAVALGVVVASVALLLVRPHATIGWAALGMFGGVVGPGWATWATILVVAGLLLALIGVTDYVGASMQRRAVRSWETMQAVPECGERVRRRAV